MHSLLISTFIAGCFGLSFQLSCSKLTASRHHLRPLPVSIMDAQWQQYYWNHYLLQQQQHQLTSGTETAHYTPTTAYGPMSHSIRMHQQHQAHPYTPPPSTSPPSHTSPPNTSPSFPPPPPPPLPTASPATPQQKSFKHSPTHFAPPAPPPTVPSPTPTIQESWHSTESCWDANAVHGHQLHRHIQPTQWSRRVGIAGLPTFEVFPWLLAYHGTADFTARTLSHGKFCGLIPTRSVAESVFTTHLLQEICDKRLDLDAIAEAMHAKAGTTVPNKTTQARAFHSPLITLLTDQLQAHSPAVAEGSAIRALKATSDDLARAREKLQAHGLELTPKKDTGRPSAPSLPHLTNHQRSQTCFNRPTPPSRTTPQKHGPHPPSNNGCGLLSPKSKKQLRKSCVYSRLAKFPLTSLRKLQPATASH